MRVTVGFRVVSAYFVAGGEVSKGVCVRAAPIIKYMVGWNSERIKAYCKRKGWECKVIGPWLLRK